MTFHTKEDISGQTIVVAGGINKQINIDVEPEQLAEIERRAYFVPGQKTVVRAIQSVDRGLNPGQKIYTITFIDGRVVEIRPKGKSSEITAGGTANFTRAFEVSINVPSIAIISALGDDDTAKYLLGSLNNESFGRLILHRQKSPVTLACRNRKTGETTLFCTKPEYYKGIFENLELPEMNPNILALLSIRPEGDLELAECLLEHLEGRKTKKIFLPHIDLIMNGDYRERLLAIISRSDILQINEREALALLGVNDRAKFNASDDLPQLAELGAKISIVTLAERGSAVIIKTDTGCEIIETPACPIEKMRDDAGAGDVFLAAVTWYQLERKKMPGRENIPGDSVLRLRIALIMANWMSSYTIRHEGPCAGIPTQAQRKKKIREVWREVMGEPYPEG